MLKTVVPLVFSFQAGGAMCANTAGSLLLVGSADGSLTLDHSKLDAGDAGCSHVALHDMWAGEAVAYAQAVWSMLSM